MSDMEAFLTGLHEVNPGARVLLTVSPVPMVARRPGTTAMYSYRTRTRSPCSAQWPANFGTGTRWSSTSLHTRSLPDRSRGAHSRTVTDAGVMRVFMARMATGDNLVRNGRHDAIDVAHAYAAMEAVTEALCDEEMYAQHDHAPERE